MKPPENSRREFLSTALVFAGTGLARTKFGLAGGVLGESPSGIEVVSPERAADYTLRIGAAALEIGKKQIVSAVTYDGSFLGRC